MKENEITGIIIGAAIEVHKSLGPGLLESAYETCLARELEVRGIPFQRQKELSLEYKGVHCDVGYKFDLLVAGKVIVEVKSVESLTSVFEAQLLTYLKLSGCRFGLLINFNVTVLKNGIKRMVYKYEDKT